MERYKIQKLIGGGTFGVVYRGHNIKTNEVVAIKKIKKKFGTWDECMNLREIKSLRKLNHPNIVKLKEVVKVNDELYLIFEYLDSNLYQVYQEQKEKGKNLPESQIRGIIYQTVAGLAYMHKHGFFHRDLKPENLMLSRDIVKICDFGLAREVRSRPPFTDYVATRWYRAPEIILKSTNYNSPVDIFAIGCIMAELYLLSPLFSGNSEMDQLVKILSVLGTPTQSQWPEGYRLAKQLNMTLPSFTPVGLAGVIPNASSEAIALLSDMLRFEAEKRPSAAQILQHPYFLGYVPPAIDALGPLDATNPNGASNEHVNFATGSQQPLEDLSLKEPSPVPEKIPFKRQVTKDMTVKKETALMKKINLDDSFDIDMEINNLLKEDDKKPKAGSKPAAAAKAPVQSSVKTEERTPIASTAFPQRGLLEPQAPLKPSKGSTRRLDDQHSPSPDYRGGGGVNLGQPYPGTQMAPSSMGIFSSQTKKAEKTDEFDDEFNLPDFKPDYKSSAYSGMGGGMGMNPMLKNQSSTYGAGAGAMGRPEEMSPGFYPMTNSGPSPLMQGKGKGMVGLSNMTNQTAQRQMNKMNQRDPMLTNSLTGLNNILFKPYNGSGGGMPTNPENTPGSFGRYKLG